MPANRIKLGEIMSSSKPCVVESIAAPDLFDERVSTGARRFFAPIHYEANYAYPLIVWLHSAADDESQLLRVMPLISTRNYVGVAPQGCSAADIGAPGYNWQHGGRDIVEANQRVLDSIDAASRKFRIHPDRIFVGGFASGGTMALRVGLANPDVFAGVFSINGHFPRGNSPLGNLLHSRKVPLLLSHGRDADGYPADEVCDDLRLLHSGGFSITMRQYPCGDDLTTQMLHDVDGWVMEQITAPPTPSNADDALRQARRN